MAEEKDPGARNDIARDTIRYVQHEAGGIGESWSEGRYAEVMKREAEGRYDDLKPNDCRALNIFLDILYGGNLARSTRHGGPMLSIICCTESRPETQFKPKST